MESSIYEEAFYEEGGFSHFAAHQVWENRQQEERGAKNRPKMLCFQNKSLEDYSLF